MIKKVFIGNCSFNLDETALQEFIETNGVQVSSVQIIRDRETGRSRGFGFAELAGSENLDNAIEKLNGQEVDGRALTVNEAKERTPRSGGGGAGGYGGKPSGNKGSRGNGRRNDRW